MSPFIAEFIGTCILIVLGAGVVSNVSLKNTAPNISTLADGTTKAAKVMESATNFQRADNFAEYSVVQAAIKKIAGHTDEQCH